MTELDSDAQWVETSLKRDLDLSRYFARFTPRHTNLYWKLARAIAHNLSRYAWQGAVITLNYDRMLEVALHRHSVFTAVRGVTFYDSPLPPLADGQVIEMCYPHGACQFFWGQHSFVGTGNVVFGPESRLVGATGVNHILFDANVPRACAEQHFPMIRRYQSNKRPSVGNYFLDEQLIRMAAIIEAAQTIAIVGSYCAHATDTHLWDPLANTHAKLHYFEPFESSRAVFAEWARSVGKRDGADFEVHATTFRDGFDRLKRVSGVRD